ncbi:MAG: hypothetical protein PHD20_02730 [Clostridia bacterium]|nr:hypothetical protein [Clostridia bacterium]
MKKNKRVGISLIVLVITIIVMIILAGAIILSLQSSGIINKASEAVEKNDLASIKQLAALIDGELKLKLSTGEDPLKGKTKSEYLRERLEAEGFNIDKYAVKYKDDNLIVEDLRIEDFYAAYNCAYVLLNNGDVFSWGLNDYGQLGHGDRQNRNLPTKVAGLSHVEKLIPGSGSNCYAILEDGTMKSWGRNSIYTASLGLGDLENEYVTIPTTMPNISNAKSMAKTEYENFVITKDGKLYGWGQNHAYGLGLGDTTKRKTAVNITGISNVSELSNSGETLFAVLSNGDVYVWGPGSNYTTGLDSVETVKTPLLHPHLKNIKKIKSVNGNVFVALTKDGKIKSWGTDTSGFGKLGLGTQTVSKVPAEIPGLSNIVFMETWLNTIFVLSDNGTVKGWGDNSSYRLGLGDTTNRNIPVEIPGISNAKSLNVNNNGEYFALTDDGIMGWAYNTDGQLGVGSAETVITQPTKVLNVTNVKDLILRAYSTFILLNDGTVMACGKNNYGQLGLGNTSIRREPIKIPTLSNVEKIVKSTAYETVYALMKDGTLKVWGRNQYGQFGVGNTTNSSVPTNIDFNSILKSIK